MRFVKGTIPGFEGERDIAVIEGDANLGAWTEQNRRLDNERGLLKKLERYIGRDSVVYDLGANIGDHTSYFAALRPRSVVAWEAYPDAYDCLAYNMQPYEDLTKLVLFQHPVGNGEEVELTKPITVELENKGARTVRPPTGEKQSLKSHRIDDLVAAGAIEPPTFMKLDIEGWECKALRGAWETVKKHMPTMLCEVGRHLLVNAGDSPEELYAMLTGIGYSVRDSDGGPWVPSDTRLGFDIIAEAR